MTGDSNYHNAVGGQKRTRWILGNSYQQEDVYRTILGTLYSVMDRLGARFKILDSAHDSIPL